MWFDVHLSAIYPPTLLHSASSLPHENVRFTPLLIGAPATCLPVLVLLRLALTGLSRLWQSPQAQHAFQDGEALRRNARDAGQACSRAQAVVQRHASREQDDSRATQHAEQAPCQRKRRRFTSQPPSELSDADADADARARRSRSRGRRRDPSASLAADSGHLRAAEIDLRDAQEAASLPDQGAEPSPTASAPGTAACHQQAAGQHRSRRRDSRHSDHSHYRHAGSGRRECEDTEPARSKRRHVAWSAGVPDTGQPDLQCRHSSMQGVTGVMQVPAESQAAQADWEDRWQMSY